jgi:orotidine-5'-phosphate decarboxylase
MPPKGEKARKVNDRLIVALEGDCIKTAEKIVETVKSEVNFFKVGMQLFTAVGPDAIKMVQDHGGKVFLDLKYHDIPSAVAKAMISAANLGVDMINIHASGGYKMMGDAMNAVSGAKKRPLVIAVTVLTSMETLADIGVQFEVREQVLRLAKLAQEVGLDGVMGSPSISSRYVKPVEATLYNSIRYTSSGFKSERPKTHRWTETDLGGRRRLLVIGRPMWRRKIH